MMISKRSILFVSLFVLSVSIVSAQVGEFDAGVDVGEPDTPGLSDFVDGVYTVDAVGTGLGAAAQPDQFHYIYKELTGSFSISAEPFDAGGAGRGGVMIRQSLDTDSAYAAYFMTSDFNIWPYRRFVKGGGTITDGDPEDDTTVSVRLERMGNTIRMYRSTADGEELLKTEVMPLEETLLAGLAATGDGSFGFFEFSNVVIEELPLSVMRSLSEGDFQPGASLSPVTITATVRDGETVDASVHEIAPRGSAITNVQASAGTVTQNPDGSFDWALDGLSGEATLTYDVALPNRPSVSWQGTFSDGVNAESYIGGVGVLPTVPEFRGPTASPIPIDPVFPTVIQIEDGEPFAPEGDYGLGLDPRLESGIFVINVGAGAGDWIEFQIRIPEDGTYYFFGNVRGEDGNSDSWHFEVDVPPSGGEDSRWNIESAGVFELDWVESESPSFDPRPFELAAGDYYVYLAGREDDGSVDWIGVTTNGSLNLATLDLDTRSVVTRAISDNLIEEGETESSATITAFIKSDVADAIRIQDVPPAGFSIESLTASEGSASIAASGNIVWDLTGVTGREVTLSYSLVPDTDTSGIFLIDGSVTLGNDQPVQIGGDRALAVKGESGDKTVFFFLSVGGTSVSDSLAELYFQAEAGAEVQLFSDTNSPGFEMPPDLTGADLAYISESVGSGNIAGMNYHLNSDVPMITSESALNDDFVYQPNVGNGVAVDTELEIVDNTHPITEGLPLGVMQVVTRGINLGHLDNPPAGVTVLATEPGNPSRARLWLLEAGASANGQTAPGLRIGVWVQTEGLELTTPAGKNLFDRVIAYALGTEPPVEVSDFMLY